MDSTRLETITKTFSNGLNIADLGPVSADKQGQLQHELATKCQLQGWSVSRDITASVELQLRWVDDFALMIFAAETINEALAFFLHLNGLSIA